MGRSDDGIELSDEFEVRDEAELVVVLVKGYVVSARLGRLDVAMSMLFMAAYDE